METKRKPFQGVINIIRFNWHFYVVTIGGLLTLVMLKNLFPQPLQNWLLAGVIMAGLTLLISLLVSFYVYDRSGLYQFKWLDISSFDKILNINAGFDETSELVKRKFGEVDLTVCDFYDPEKHTEISIKRARKAYPPNRETISVQTDQLPFPENTFDKVLAILSAHEIRDEKERIRFFKELKRITKPSGEIFVTEHLRDVPNFLAYTIGFLHFHSKKSWEFTFKQANLIIRQQIKTTPFITTFILTHDGDTF